MEGRINRCSDLEDFWIRSSCDVITVVVNGPLRRGSVAVSRRHPSHVSTNQKRTQHSAVLLVLIRPTSGLLHQSTSAFLKPGFRHYVAACAVHPGNNRA